MSDLKEDFWGDKYKIFLNTFGYLGWDAENYGVRALSYFRKKDKGTNIRYDLNFLTENEISKLMIQSMKDNFDYLYETVKTHAFIPEVKNWKL